MPDYLPLVDNEAVMSAWTKDHDKWTKHVVQRYGKQALKHGAKKAAAHFTFGVGGAIFDAPAIYFTRGHIQRLEQLLNEPKPYACECKDTEETITCVGSLQYAINQKRAKKSNKWIGVAPVVNEVVSAARWIKDAVSDPPVDNSELHASTMFNRARGGCPMARATIAELVGNYRKQDAWLKMLALLEWDKGTQIIKEKLAAS